MKLPMWALVPLMLSGCVTTETRVTGLWAAPGGPVFGFKEKVSSWSTGGSIVSTKEDNGEKGLGWQGGRDVERVDRTDVFALDPRTGVRTQLGWSSGELRPFYYNPLRRILWVTTQSQRIIGLVAGGVVFPGDDPELVLWGTPALATAEREYLDWRKQNNLVAPYAFADKKIWNAVTDQIVEVDLGPTAKWFAYGSRLRAIENKYGSSEVRTTTIDWAGPAGQPPEQVTWTMPPTSRGSTNVARSDSRWMVSS